MCGVPPAAPPLSWDNENMEFCLLMLGLSSGVREVPRAGVLRVEERREVRRSMERVVWSFEGMRWILRRDCSVCGGSCEGALRK